MKRRSNISAIAIALLVVVVVAAACSDAGGGDAGSAVAAPGSSAEDETTGSRETPSLRSLTTLGDGSNGEVATPPTRGWMGTNLGVASSFAEWAFIDAFRFSRSWVSGTPAGEGRQPVWNDKRQLDLDDDGWVRSLLPDQVARTAMLTGPLPIRPAGRYIVLYEGQGTMQYTGGASLVESAPGRDVIDVVETGEIALNITAVDPDDYLRNIRVIMPGGVYADDPATLVLEPESGRSDYLSFEEHYADLVFHPDFLASLQGYASVRYMNWMLTNNSTVAAWDDRPLPSDARWTIDGVPVEVMVDLANKSGTDPWFTLPHLATDEFVREFAAVVRDQLDPRLTPYLEYSNEVWNTQFDQHEYSRQQGLALGLDGDEFTAAIKFYGQRSGEVFAIWDEVFAGARDFVAVVGSKTSDPDAVSRVALDSDNAVEHADLLAIAGYFGGRANWPASCEEIAGMSLDDFFVYLAEDAVPRALNGIEAQIEVADEYGLDIGVYEGGQHLRVNGCSGDDAKKDSIGELFDAANRDPRMGDIYLDFFAAVEFAGIDHFSHYTNTGAWTGFGRFGAREHLMQPRSEAPKYDAILTYAEGG